MTRLAACLNCAAPQRDGLRFCTQCGIRIDGAADVRITRAAPGSSEPARAPRRYAPPPSRSRAATRALVTGTLPLGVSVAGNLATADLGRRTLATTEATVTSGAWAPVVVVLVVVFVVNAALLTVCVTSGTRAIRETGNGITRGRTRAVTGLAAGLVNLALLISGLGLTLSGLGRVLD